MPGGDNTGPLGEGPVTGRGMGRCTGGELQGSENYRGRMGRSFGRRFHRGMGLGSRHEFGFRFGYGTHFGNPAMSEETWIENDIRILKDQVAALEDRLAKLRKK